MANENNFGAQITISHNIVDVQKKLKDLAKLINKLKKKEIKLKVTVNDQASNKIASIRKKVTGKPAKLKVQIDDKASKQISNIKKKVTGKSVKLKIQADDKVTSKIKTIRKNISSSPIKLKVRVDQRALKNVKKTLKDASKLANLGATTGKGSKGKGGSGSSSATSQLDTYKKEIIKTEQALSSLKKQLRDVKKLTKTDSLQSTYAKNPQVSNLEQSLKNKINEVKGRLNEYNTKVASSESKQQSATQKGQTKTSAAAPIKISAEDIQNIRGYNQEVSRYKTNIKDTFEAIKYHGKKLAASGNNIMGFTKVYDKAISFMNQNMTQLMMNPAFKKKFDGFITSLNKSSFTSVRDANVYFADLKTQALKAGIGVETLGTKIQKAFQGKIFSQFSYMGIMAITTTVSDLINNVKEIDSAMTELKKVTNGTSSDYDNFLAGAETRAKNVGASLAEVVNATADYARLGYSIPDASKLADTALIYSNVGDDVEDITQATESMISTMQGFGIAAEDSMSIVDKFNEVANNYATSAGDIGEITKRSAAAMAAAGNDLDQTIALGVAANEVQQDA